jgi:hypothetical protein
MASPAKRSLPAMLFFYLCSMTISPALLRERIKRNAEGCKKRKLNLIRGKNSFFFDVHKMNGSPYFKLKSYEKSDCYAMPP